MNTILKRLSCAACAIVSFLCFVQSNADAFEPIKLEIITNQIEGKGDVGLVIVANLDVKQATVTLSDSLGNSMTLKSGPIAENSKKMLVIRQQPGRVSYAGKLDVVFASGDGGSMPVSFELNVLTGLKATILADRFSLEQRTIVFSASRPVSRVEYTVLSDTGTIMDQANVPFNNPAADTPLQLQWKEVPGTVIRIDVTVYDNQNTFSKVELSPWHVEVEHEEVNFPSGSDKIIAEESPKLDKAYEHLKEKIRLYGKLVQLNLYIVGYTDTVGKPDYNIELSNRRAKSIARYFRKKGITFPIYYQGFGEEVLFVKTPDETDELSNRRALYLLGGDFKPTGPQIPRANWKRLQ